MDFEPDEDHEAVREELSGADAPRSGRPRKRSVRASHLDIRLTDAEKIRLDDAASSAGRQTADWAREILLTATSEDQLGLSREVSLLRRRLDRLDGVARLESLLTSVVGLVQKLEEGAAKDGRRTREVLREILRYLEAQSSGDLK